MRPPAERPALECIRAAPTGGATQRRSRPAGGAFALELVAGSTPRLAIPFVGRADPWCSGPTCQPVTLEIAGSNPVGSAISQESQAVPWRTACFRYLLGLPGASL